MEVTIVKKFRYVITSIVREPIQEVESIEITIRSGRWSYVKYKYIPKANPIKKQISKVLSAGCILICVLDNGFRFKYK